MTHKTTMPEPVAYPSDEWVEAFFGRPDETGYYYFRGDFGNIAYRFQLGAQASNFITTDQAEAYANARVREALEELNNQAQKLYESSLKSRLTRDGAADEDELKAIDLWNVEAVGMAKAYTTMQKAIRALIPKEPPCET